MTFTLSSAHLPAEVYERYGTRITQGEVRLVCACAESAYNAGLQGLPIPAAVEATLKQYVRVHALEPWTVLRGYVDEWHHEGLAQREEET